MTLADLIATLNDLAVQSPAACLASVVLELPDPPEDEAGNALAYGGLEIDRVGYSAGIVVVYLCAEDD